MNANEPWGIGPLDTKLAARWRAHLVKLGDDAESRRLGLSRLALVRAAAGLPVRRNVRVAVRETLGDVG